MSRPCVLRILGSVLLSFLAVGCGANDGLEEGALSPAAGLDGTATRFPVRTDWLVDKVPEAAPPHWFTPGYPPLVSLRDPAHTPDKDVAEGLQAEQKKRNILDPAKELTPEDKADFERVMAQTFGTPTAPTIHMPDAAALKKLGGEKRELAMLPPAEAAKAALHLDDATLARGAAVFRRWCLHCHGPTGGGDGSNAPELQPLPRDYRQGVFKFVTSSPDAAGRPLKSDLERTIRRGLEGSMMPAFVNLSQADLDDVASYVIFLSVRGESEYQAMKVLIKYSDNFLSVDHEIMVQLLRALSEWGKAQGQTITVPPENTPSRGDRLASAARGYRLFSEAGCVACHANYGRTQVLKYDAWGGVTQPRDLTLGVFRGGRQGSDLYIRIYSGIAGAGMPGHKQLLEKDPAAQGQPDKIWDIVHFIQALGDPHLRRALAEKYQLRVG